MIPAPLRDPHRHRPTVGSALLLTATLALAACSSSGITQQASPSATVPVAMPAGAVEESPTDVPEPSVDDCDATASLAPLAERPAPGQMPEGSAMAEIVQRGYLRAGVDQSSYLAGYRDPLTGQFLGFDIDILRAVATALFGDDDPDRIQFTVMTNSQRQRAIADGEVDIVASIMTITCQRRYPERYFDADYVERFPGVEFSAPYHVAQQRILVPVSSPITGPDDLAGARVCVPVNTTVEQNIAHYQLPPGSEPMVLVAVDGRTDCLSLLQQGKVDALTTDDTILTGFAAQDPTVAIVGEGFHQQPYGLAISKDRPELTRFVNHLLAEMMADGRWLDIFGHWVGQGGVLGDDGLVGLEPPTPHYRDS